MLWITPSRVAQLVLLIMWAAAVLWAIELFLLIAREVGWF